MVLIIVSERLLQLRGVAHRGLPAGARAGRSLGKVSGWGWGFGYFGGMLALGICLGYVIWAQGAGSRRRNSCRSPC
jgi:UMF1 family MFS transporter